MGVGAASGGGYPERLVRRLRDAGTPVSLTNLAVSGSRIADLCGGQLSRAVLAQPELVTLGIGTNDVWRGTPLSEYSSALQDVASALVPTGAQVVVSNIPDFAFAPAAVMVPKEWYEGRIEPFNAAIATVAAQARWHLVDVYGASQHFLPRHPELFSGDGFHPSDAGYERWAEELWPTVARVARWSKAGPTPRTA